MVLLPCLARRCLCLLVVRQCALWAAVWLCHRQLTWTLRLWMLVLVLVLAEVSLLPAVHHRAQALAVCVLALALLVPAKVAPCACLLVRLFPAAMLEALYL